MTVTLFIPHQHVLKVEAERLRKEEETRLRKAMSAEKAKREAERLMKVCFCCLLFTVYCLLFTVYYSIILLLSVYCIQFIFHSGFHIVLNPKYKSLLINA